MKCGKFWRKILTKPFHFPVCIKGGIAKAITRSTSVCNEWESMLRKCVISAFLPLFYVQPPFCPLFSSDIVCKVIDWHWPGVSFALVRFCFRFPYRFATTVTEKIGNSMCSHCRWRVFVFCVFVWGKIDCTLISWLKPLAWEASQFLQVKLCI